MPNPPPQCNSCGKVSYGDTIYGVVDFNKKHIYMPLVERKYTWWEKALMAIGMCLVFMIAVFAVFFYYYFPAQLVWLIPSLFVLLLIK